MSTAIAGKKLSTRPVEPGAHQRARQSKPHPECRSTTIKLSGHANIACVIVAPRQSSSRRDRRNGHPDCRCVPIQIVALQPKQISTGDRTILGKISRRGNRYLRVMFVQAAWVVLVRIKNWERYGLKSWIEAAKRRLHHNVLAIALANKLARIAWS